MFISISYKYFVICIINGELQLLVYMILPLRGGLSPPTV